MLRVRPKELARNLCLCILLVTAQEMWLNNFVENHHLTTVDSVSVYCLMSNNAIITQLDQNIRQIELYTNCKIEGQIGCDQCDLLIKFGDPLNIS